MSVDSLDEVHRYSLDEYHQLVESGGLNEDTHVELLEGLVVDMSPKTPDHERAIEFLAAWLRDRLDRSLRLRIAAPLTLAGSEPEPDLSVVAPGTVEPYHPASATLVIEVSASSLRRDLGPKARVYAAASVDEYWVVDLEGERLVAHRGLTDEGYAEVEVVAADGAIQATALPLPSLPVAELLAAARG